MQHDDEDAPSIPVTGIAFPGMGPVSFPDVAKFMLVNSFARDLLAEADEVLGYDLFGRLRDSRTDYSEVAQVAFLLNCLASARWAEAELGIEPSLCTGASFGGKAAAVHSGALTAAEGIWLTAQLCRVEAEYFAEEHTDVVTLSFARTPREELDGITAELEARDQWFEISCYVDDDFSMVSLHRSEVPWMQDRLRSVGGLPLYVMDPPLHCSVFDGLRDRVEARLFGRLDFRPPRVPVVADQDGTLRDTADGVRRMLLDGIVQPVRWPLVIDTLRARGVRRLCVAGPDALFGRVAVTTRAFPVVPANPRVAMLPRRQPAA